MKVKEEEGYKILTDEKDDVEDFASFLRSQHNAFKNDNVVIDIIKYGELSLEELLSFLDLSNEHRKGKRSFVIVNDAINIEKIPEELIVVPTLMEAGDVIQMEEIERDLGF
ncbi:hypothetical protein [Salinimicrobium xinjiangense]|uniref:hypothetical protein n=1 Tax=Salinimicrobium xinjiangense TaxID=438596 RepID=UPI00042824EB|nr:hypothetical protein [Salinimicrobium xinjiangense]